MLGSWSTVAFFHTPLCLALAVPWKPASLGLSPHAAISAISLPVFMSLTGPSPPSSLEARTMSLSFHRLNQTLVNIYHHAMYWDGYAPEKFIFPELSAENGYIQQVPKDHAVYGFRDVGED